MRLLFYKEAILVTYLSFNNFLVTLFPKKGVFGNDVKKLFP